MTFKFDFVLALNVFVKFSITLLLSKINFEEISFQSTLTNCCEYGYDNLISLLINQFIGQLACVPMNFEKLIANL